VRRAKLAGLLGIASPPRSASAAALALVVVGAGCVTDGHPLGTDGAVQIRVSVSGPLYATDSIGADGKPKGARQTPFSTDIVLKITEEDESSHGGIVSVRVEPAEALDLGPALDGGAEGAKHENGEEPTCDLVDGAFQCRGNSEGLARFSVTSNSDWSGAANVIVSWSNRNEEREIAVLPAGLPRDATNFALIGLNDGEIVAPTYLALDCSVGSVPNDLGSKWPEGRIRARELFVRATPPAATPGIVENAPVIVEALSAEGALSEDETCTARTTRLRVLLDQKGESPRFFACFSDLGGEVGFGVHSGEKTIDPGPVAVIDPEPRLMRVRVLDGKSTVTESLSPEPLFEVSAFDVSLQPIVVPLDLAVEGDGVLILESAAAETAPASAAPVQISAVPNAAGQSRLLVTPRLLSMPECKSEPITVVP
jgi:hypothetical protein